MIKSGKSNVLIRLKEEGFLVPPFFVCDATWSEKQVIERINIDIPNTSYFAVRSSAKNEDSKDRSYAGHFYTAIGVSKQNVFQEVLKVQESFKGMQGSVIVQEFIASDVSGVVFSEVGKDTIVINSTIGLCQPVVNGQECDEYQLNRNGTLINKTISSKKTTLLFKEGKIVSEISSKESLTDTLIMQVVDLGLNIQNIFGSPQDIEWCFVDGKLYTLQSRHITKEFNVSREEYFDSANIAESYSGIVLPLTCSFARMVYRQVYMDLLRMSGVSKSKLEYHYEIFDNLLGFFYGRMYYNMNNWYRMAEFVPGYNRNKENFELMITSNVRQNVEKKIKPSIFLSISYPFIVAIKVAIFGITSQIFKSGVKKHLTILRNQDFENLSYSESIALFEDLNNSLLRRWYITLENDFFVMTYLGILKKMLGEELLQKAIIFPSKATEQVNSLALLSKQMSELKELWSAVQGEDVSKFDTELMRNPKISSALDVYLHTFGGRFANELKLESIGVDEDRRKLLVTLKAYQNYTPRIHAVRVELPFSFFKRNFVMFILNKFKKYASRREEFRLLRSNTFGMTRKLFRHMGILLVNKGVIQHQDDIFYLEMHQILDFQAESNVGLAEMIKKRKIEYSSYDQVVPPAHFSTINRRPPAVNNLSTIRESSIYAKPTSPGIVRGKVKVFKEFHMPAVIDFDILVTSHTDPGWTSLIALSKGLIIEHGGVLSHASIVARELGIPAVIGATNATDSLIDYQMVEIDGSTGIIKLL